LERDTKKKERRDYEKRGGLARKVERARELPKKKKKTRGGDSKGLVFDSGAEGEKKRAGELKKQSRRPRSPGEEEES